MYPSILALFFLSVSIVLLGSPPDDRFTYSCYSRWPICQLPFYSISGLIVISIVTMWQQRHPKYWIILSLSSVKCQSEDSTLASIKRKKQNKLQLVDFGGSSQATLLKMLAHNNTDKVSSWKQSCHFILQERVR